jgi:hypothetical protein
MKDFEASEIAGVVAEHDAQYAGINTPAFHEKVSAASVPVIHAVVDGEARPGTGLRRIADRILNALVQRDIVSFRGKHRQTCMDRIVAMLAGMGYEHR